MQFFICVKLAVLAPRSRRSEQQTGGASQPEFTTYRITSLADIIQSSDMEKVFRGG